MVDFRYHLVSLVAVFLALACGIALGAGPLRDAIGDTVSGRNAALTAQNAQLTKERDAATADQRAAD
ncbi:MAG: copper transporter, partial [Cellulomonas sp.]|nr:copper transporter [Cellulomonas sp.]